MAIIAAAFFGVNENSGGEIVIIGKELPPRLAFS
jgi:hypothetical protein